MDTMRIYGLTRASTEKQEDSPDNQQYRMLAYCTKEGWTEPQWLDEPLGTSGTIKFRYRPRGRWILQNLKAGDTLMVTDVDRIGRNAVDIMDTAERLRRMGVRLIILQFMGMDIDVSSEMGYLILMIFAWGAQYEHKRIAERTRAAIRRKIELGTYCHHAGWGKKKVRDANGKGWTWEWDNEQLGVILEVATRRSHGHRVDDICEDLWSKGVLDHRGILWGRRPGEGPVRYRGVYECMVWFHRALRKGEIPEPYASLGRKLRTTKMFTLEVRKQKNPRKTLPKTDPRDSWTADQWRKWAEIECPDAEIPAETVPACDTSVE